MINKSDRLIKGVINISKSLKFHNSTKIRSFKDTKTTPYNSWPEPWKKVYYKAYPRFKQTILPRPRRKLIDLQKAILSRESYRKFAAKPIIPSELSDLLYYSAGLKIWEEKQTKRVYPSAGGRYPLEVYPFIFKVRGIPPGIYHYHLKTHSLELILEPPFFKTTMKQFNQSWIKKAGAVFVITAIFGRSTAKYGDRGYRHILTEYGHMAQNFYLMASALGLGCCSIGGFIDNGLNEMLDIDGIDEGVVGVVAIGSKKEKP